MTVNRSLVTSFTRGRLRIYMEYLFKTSLRLARNDKLCFERLFDLWAIPWIKRLFNPSTERICDWRGVGGSAIGSRQWRISQHDMFVRHGALTAWRIRMQLVPVLIKSHQIKVSTALLRCSVVSGSPELKRERQSENWCLTFFDFHVA
jgi:hypothetical protein